VDALLDPLTASAPAEVPLPQAPLARVVAQISFPVITSLGKADFIAPFQEALRADYPVLRPEQTILFGLPGLPGGDKSPQVIWRFSDVKRVWRLSLAPTFVALETTVYVSRADFLRRLDKVLTALAKHINPQLIDRIGVRYIDRIKGDVVNRLPELVRREVIGILAMHGAEHVQHSISESLFVIPKIKANLAARWGRLPAGSTIDPSVLEPLNEPSWILDLDIFCAEPKPFSKESVIEDVRTYSERIYTFFRWAVTDEFLKLYGGNV
jgi:uncharacterized protein (TIGR04255 family)